MSIDTENAGRAECLDSSPGRSRRSNSVRSARLQPGNSTPGRAGEDGEVHEPKPTSLDVLLSLLQSDLGEIQDFGGVVRFFDNPNGLVIQLPGVRLCKIHAMIHSGETCPHC
jgi:hypothetical protein